MGAIKELIDYSEGVSLAGPARAELAEKDARIERLTEALEHIKRHQEIVAGTSVGGLSVTHKIASDALSGTPTTKRWRCESCGERFDVETFSHARGEDDGHGNPVQVECGPVSEEATPTTAKLVPVERLKSIEWFLVYSYAVGDMDKIAEIYVCPCCGQERSEGHAPDCWLAAALREEIVPPKPTPPPLREFREGEIPKRRTR